jgi:glycosyltransferase involved in cell wall biosynthesis
MEHRSAHIFPTAHPGAEEPSIVVNGKFLRAGPTGVHRVAHELLRAIDAIDGAGTPRFEALVTPGEGLPETVPSIPVRAVGRLRGQLWEQIDLPRAARGRPILSLCNLAPIAARNAVTMIHDAQVFITPESYSPAFRAWYRLVMRGIGRRHRRILTVSEFSKAQLVHYRIAPAERIAVIHNGVDHILRVPADATIAARLGLVRQKYAVALANTQKHKNIGVLLRAFARAEMARLTLVLVGGATRQSFEALGHVVPDNVLFAGPVSDAELRGLIEDALCLAFPSLTEGFGLPPVEAMLLGCPAVIAPCGALPEVCGPAAVQADPGSPAVWSAALRALRDDPGDWVARSEAGRLHAAGFTWARAGRQLLAALGS